MQLQLPALERRPRCATTVEAARVMCRGHMTQVAWPKWRDTWVIFCSRLAVVAPARGASARRQREEARELPETPELLARRERERQRHRERRRRLREEAGQTS
jgi:hypothetical protein